MIEKYVSKYGEYYRKVIVTALEFLEENEPTWKLNTPIDKDLYIADIVSRIAK